MDVAELQQLGLVRPVTAAALLGVSPSQITLWSRRADFPTAVELDGVRYYRAEDLKKWRKRTAPAGAPRGRKSKTRGTDVRGNKD